MNKTKIYFNEELHKYTDEFGNEYISVTTVLGKYEEKFDTDEVARRCYKAGLRGNPKYKGKSIAQIKAEWTRIKDEACDKGNKKHNYLESVVKRNNKYDLVKHNYVNDRIYTIEDIVEDHSFGELDLDSLVKEDIHTKYPIIYNLLLQLSAEGYKLYAEIGVFDTDVLVSGLIDLLAVHHNRKEFIILDWKTNRDDFRYEAGYLEKDNFGNVTDKFIRTEKKLKYPLDMFEASNGYKYSFQLSLYSRLVEKYGFKNNGIVLCHIRDIKYTYKDVLETGNHNLLGKEKVQLIPIKYYKDEMDKMLQHYKDNNKNRKIQFSL